jgi:hypothetical protein
VQEEQRNKKTWSKRTYHRYLQHHQHYNDKIIRFLSAIDHEHASVNDGSTSKTEVQHTTVLAKDSYSVCTSPVAGRKKLKEVCCRKLRLYRNSKLLFPVSQIAIQTPNGVVRPLKLETFKKHGKSFQCQKCVTAINALLVLEATPVATSMKIWVQKWLIT